jgi:VanZ family protein
LIREAPLAFRIDFYLHNPMRRIVQYWLYGLYWLPPLLWMGLIFWFSTDRFSGEATGSRFEEIVGWLAPWIEEGARARLHYLFRKLGHLTEYALLAILWMRALEAPSAQDQAGLAKPNRWRSRALLVLLIVAGYALLDEWHQTFTVNRTGSLSDSAIDTIGGVLGLLLRRWLQRPCQRPGLTPK